MNSLTFRQLSPRRCSSHIVSKVCSTSVCVSIADEMQRSLEQRYAIKVCANFGKFGSATLQLLRTAYGDAALSSGGADVQKRKEGG